MLNNPFFSFLLGSASQQQNAGNPAVSAKKSPAFGLTTASGIGPTGAPPQMLFAGGSQEHQGDQLDMFRQQIQAGVIAPNLMQPPALPYTATRGWIV